MATNIPPHNLGELCDALLLLINDPDTGVDELMQFVKGPDFPTGGQVYAGQGLVDAYRTGRGIVKMRGRMEVKERGKNTQSIVITEIPYAVNKSGLVEKIAALVNDRRIEGVSDLKDCPTETAYASKWNSNGAPFPIWSSMPCINIRRWNLLSVSTCWLF